MAHLAGRLAPVRVRTDLFAATFEELRDYEVPPEGPAEEYPTVEGEDLDIAVLWELCRILLDTDLETFLRDTHLVSGPETPGELDKPTVELLPGVLIDALLSITAEDLTWLAERWTDVPDWRGQHSIDELTMTLIGLAYLANIVVHEEKLMFLWTCLVEEPEDDEDALRNDGSDTSGELG